MSQENENKLGHLTLDQQDNAEKAAIRIAAIKAARELSETILGRDTKWDLLQDITQEIMASELALDPENYKPVATELEKKIVAEINTRYSEDEETKKTLLDAAPNARSLRRWIKSEGWNEAVWGKLRTEGLFTTEKRAAMIESIRKRGMDKSDVAAKMWLVMSGDYKEDETAQKDRSLEMFREINEMLHKKKD